MSLFRKFAVVILGFVLVLALLFQWQPWEPRRQGLRLNECVEAIADVYDYSIYSTLNKVPHDVVLALRAMPEAATRRFSKMIEAPVETWFDKQVNAVGEFAKLKFDRKPRVLESEYALVGIGVLGSAAVPIIPQLERMLNSGEPEAMRRALDAMVLVGHSSIPTLTNLMHHTNAELRLAAFLRLNSMVPRSVVAFEYALFLIENGNKYERKRAVEAISSTTNDVERSWRITKELLDDQDLEVRQSALLGLRFFGDRPLQLVPRFASQLRSNTVLLETAMIINWAKSMTNQPAALVECLTEGLQNPAIQHRSLIWQEIMQLPQPERILPAIERLYLDATPGSEYHHMLAQMIASLAPETAARLNIPSNLVPQGQVPGRR